MTVIYFVRHAHADWVPDEQRPLSPQGAGDARQIAALLDTKPITAIYSSPACRAVQTVEPLAARLKLSIRTIYDLRERELSQTPVANFMEAVQHTWNDPTYALPSGESNCVAQQRGVQVVNLLMHHHPHEHIVIATHGNLLALILQHYDPSVNFTFWQSLTMPDVYQLQVDQRTSPVRHRLWS